ncbi:tyrosine-type recombinase/integrase [Xanthobacter flavus]|uniref:tyrosine-type recombinase/integrase n=1 Tax=Xanthobacter flavus TaxID=281 RepID=UPI00372BCC5D
MRHIGARCRDLQGQMLEWSGENRSPARNVYDGSLRSLVRLYQADEESPYRDLRPRTQTFYDYGLKLLDENVGEMAIAAVSGADVRRWYKKFKEPKADGEPERVRRAYAAIQMLRVVINYGRSLKLPECRDLGDALSAMEFKGVQRRETRITHAQVCAFRKAAHEAGRPSMALGITLQFDLGMRQRDVIGEWLPDTSPGAEGIVDHGLRWSDGLTFSHITGTVLRKRTSKTGKVVEHDLAQLPDALAELERIPPLRRIGPLVLNEETGLPYKRRVYTKWFRIIARAAGIPDEVWSMDARAGAVTEALDAGAQPLDVMNAAGHTQLSTTQGYDRTTLKKTARVAQLRVASRKNVE